MDWQAIFQRVQLKSEAILSPLKKETSNRLSELYSMEDRALLMERMVGIEENEETGYRNPLRLLNMLINEREERYRNYFHEMRSHLDVLRNVVNPGEPENRRNPLIENNNPQTTNINTVENWRENVGEIVNEFRERIIQGFNENIEILQEVEEEKKEDKSKILENLEKEIQNLEKSPGCQKMDGKGTCIR